MAKPVGGWWLSGIEGKYAANKTENLMLGKVFAIRNGVGSYIEVSHNHRYITHKADTYHLDFELKVDEWSDEGYG